MAEIGGILPLAAYEKDGEEGDDDIRILWKDIQVIGDDIILVCASECVPPESRGRKQGIFDNIFR